MIDACARAGDVERAEHWLRELRDACGPNIVSFSSILHACARWESWGVMGSHGCRSTSNHQETTGFSPCFHLPGFHLGYLFLTHGLMESHEWEGDERDEGCGGWRKRGRMSRKPEVRLARCFLKRFPKRACLRLRAPPAPHSEPHPPRIPREGGRCLPR